VGVFVDGLYRDTMFPKQRPCGLNQDSRIGCGGHGVHVLYTVAVDYVEVHGSFGLISDIKCMLVNRYLILQPHIDSYEVSFSVISVCKLLYRT